MYQFFAGALFKQLHLLFEGGSPTFMFINKFIYFSVVLRHYSCDSICDEMLLSTLITTDMAAQEHQRFRFTTSSTAEGGYFAGIAHPWASIICFS